MGEEVKKVCTGCDIPKDLNQFYDHKGGKYGKGSVCKECKNAKATQWKKDHPQHVASYNKKSYKKWYQKNRKKKLAANKTWRQEHPESQRQHNKQYKQAHLEELKAYYKKYYYSNRDRNLEVDKKWRTANPSKVRTRNKNRDMKKYFARYPEKFYAHAVVRQAVKYGKLPPARTLACVECGNQADDYHHHKGYAPEHWLDVVPVCRPCHGRIHRKH